MRKKRMEISVNAGSFEEAKELLDNLEALKENYFLCVSMTISPLEDFEALNEWT